jgi:hypothetical protein
MPDDGSARGGQSDLGQRVEVTGRRIRAAG